MTPLSVHGPCAVAVALTQGTFHEPKPYKGMPSSWPVSSVGADTGNSP